MGSISCDECLFFLGFLRLSLLSLDLLQYDNLDSSLEPRDVNVDTISWVVLVIADEDSSELSLSSTPGIGIEGDRLRRGSLWTVTPLVPGIAPYPPPTFTDVTWGPSMKLPVGSRAACWPCRFRLSPPPPPPPPPPLPCPLRGRGGLSFPPWAWFWRSGDPGDLSRLGLLNALRIVALTLLAISLPLTNIGGIGSLLRPP